MRITKAFFVKQLQDFMKNMSVTMMFIVFPLISFVMVTFMDGYDAAFQNLNFTAMFMGMGPLVYVANTIAEDNEYKSLRMLIMAGVKPLQYLGGIIFFALLVSIPVLLAFAWIGDIEAANLPLFLGIGLLGALASCLLGATVGLFSKNVQQCAAIYTPLMMVISFMPMLAFFNPAVANIADFLFSRQIMLALLDIQIGIPYEWHDVGSLPVNMQTSLIVIAGSAVAFAILFAIAYKKKGLKG